MGEVSLPVPSNLLFDNSTCEIKGDIFNVDLFGAGNKKTAHDKMEINVAVRTFFYNPIRIHLGMPSSETLPKKLEVTFGAFFTIHNDKYISGKFSFREMLIIQLHSFDNARLELPNDD